MTDPDFEVPPGTPEGAILIQCTEGPDCAHAKTWLKASERGCEQTMCISCVRAIVTDGKAVPVNSKVPA